MDRISVIIPVYNTEKYLVRCVDSILNQTYTDLEIILVDDGSTDKSGSICDTYREKDPRIKVIHKENAGLPQARKSGVEAATGQFIYFVDSDDWVEDNLLALLHRAITSDHADISCCGYYLDYPDKEADNKKVPVTGQVSGEQIDGERAAELIHNVESVYPYMWNKLFRAGLFLDLEFPKEHTMSEDYFILIQILPRIKGIRLIPEILCHYMQPAESMCNAGFNKSHVFALEKYHKAEDYLFRMYPALKKNIISFRIIQELAMITAMTRNSHYDKGALKIIKRDIRRHITKILGNGKVPIQFRVSALCVFVNYRILVVGYKAAQKLTNTRTY